MLQPGLIVLLAVFAAAGCHQPKKEEAPDKAAVALSERPLMLTREDLSLVQSRELNSGPVVTGSIQPERKADLRSEISSIVLQVLKENGETVRKGDLLVRLDDTSIRDSLHSAQETERAAIQSFEQAERQLQRLKTLRASGMTSAQQLEDAEIRRNNIQSDLVAARARAVQAKQQLQRTEVRAPFDGVVSERKVSSGDTAQIGKELLKVIDPSSMRFEGLVSADKVSVVKIGQNVSFRINGYAGQVFQGKVKRVDPAANATTRQVEVLISFTDANPSRIAGLFAEGMIEASNNETLMIENSALIRDGDKAYAWRFKDGVVSKILLQLGERDLRRGNVAVRAGLVNGDRVIRNPLSALKDGQKAQLVTSAEPPKVQPAQQVQAVAAMEK